MIGDLTAANVWSLFDSTGFTYNNYAVRAGYWPRLFHLSIPGMQFEAESAAGMPSAFAQDGSLYAATIPLRTDLAWSDGSPFSAQDVAFTVNTALKFQLGFDWHDYYNPQMLDHAEAVDPSTVEFFFKEMPDVGTWQYGALQGPVVQSNYWAKKVDAAEALLPPPDLLQSEDTIRAELAAAQQRLNGLYAEAVSAQGEAARQIQANIRREQGNVDEATNDLASTEAEYDNSMQEARGALYAADAHGEPLLGAWAPARNTTNAPTPPIENARNPTYPGAAPSFNRAVYYTFSTQADALVALEKGDVDVVLDPSPPAVGAGLGQPMISPDRALHFLVFSLRSGPFTEAPLRKALACVINQGTLESQMEGRAAALSSFVPAREGSWYAADAHLPCDGLEPSARVEQAIKMLQSAGYTWKAAPSLEAAGEGLMSPGGKAVNAMHLMTAASDELATAAANYVQLQARLIGIPMTVQSTTLDVIDYAVLSSGDFDAAVVGWRVSRYPGYLCDWFGPSGTFAYPASEVAATCGELGAISDLGVAVEKVHEIQSALAQDVPMIPLYSGVTRDFYRNVAYPFPSLLDGLSGSYGAPALAMPASP